MMSFNRIFAILTLRLLFLRADAIEKALRKDQQNGRLLARFSCERWGGHVGRLENGFEMRGVGFDAVK